MKQIVTTWNKVFWLSYVVRTNTYIFLQSGVWCRVRNYMIPGWGGILGDDVAARSRNTQHLGGGVGSHRDWGCTCPRGSSGSFFKRPKRLFFRGWLLFLYFFPAWRLYESAEMSRLHSPLFFECTALSFQSSSLFFETFLKTITQPFIVAPFHFFLEVF